MDWCVSDYADANHPPVPRVAGELRRELAPGERVVLDANGSRDPDGDGLKFEWVYYPEPGSYRGPAPKIEGANSPRASFLAPAVDREATLHFVLGVTDEGSPALTRYRRVVVEVDAT